MIKKLRSRIKKINFNLIIPFFKENLFMVLAFIIILIIFILPIKLPEHCKFDNLSTVLSVIIGSLSAILGIVVAIQLVAFEILRRKFYSFAYKEFFKSKNSKYLIVRFIISIVLSLLTLLTLEEPASNQNYLFTYLSLLLFLYCLLILFPSTKRLILLSISKEKLLEIINKIDTKTIQDYNNTSPRESIKQQIEIIENNPIYILSDICVRLINEEDRMTINFILLEISSRLISLLNKSDKRDEARKIINSFFVIYKSTFSKAVYHKQAGIILTLLYIIEKLYNYCAENKFVWVSMIEMDDDIEKIIIKLIQRDNIDLSKRGIWLLERVLLKQLYNNLPPEEEIDMLYEFDPDRKVDHDKSLQWDHICNHHLYMFDKIISTAINLEKAEAVSTGLTSLVSIADRVDESTLGDRKKSHIISLCYYYASSLSIKSVDAGLLKKVQYLIPFNSLEIYSIINSAKDYSKSALQHFGGTFIEIARRNNLNLYHIHDIGSTGRHCISKVDQSDFHKEATIYLINILNDLHNIMLQGNQIEKEYLLTKIHSQAESIRKWFKADEVQYSDFLAKIDYVIESMNKHIISESNKTESNNWTKIN
ncbi:MAG: DUF2254 domain-containing protein [Candidatus Cloacimonetes bacterium]|nr:DUF2254 domain-containing protein [Candidatus Cloacimonadota bacterium]